MGRPSILERSHPQRQPIKVTHLLLLFLSAGGDASRFFVEPWEEVARVTVELLQLPPVPVPDAFYRPGTSRRALDFIARVGPEPSRDARVSCLFDEEADDKSHGDNARSAGPAGEGAS